MTRSRHLQHPLLSFCRRLGDLRGKTPRAIVAEYYAAGLAGNSATDDPSKRCPNAEREGAISTEHIPKLASRQFAVDRDTSALFTDITYRDPLGPGRSAISFLTAFHRRETSSPPAKEQDHFRDRLNWPAPVQRDAQDNAHLYLFRDSEPLFQGGRTTNVAALGPRRVVWVGEYRPRGPDGSCDGSRVTIWYRAEWETSPIAVHMVFEPPILDIAVSPEQRALALATSEGVSVMDTTHQSLLITKISLGSEQMKVCFKDEKILMSGARSGSLTFSDIRSSAGSHSSALRLQHSSAISGIRPLPDGNRILVNGLTDMKIYDLRYACAPPLPPRKKSTRWHHPPTTPVLTFNVPPTRRQHRYGLGFAYDPELNIVLSASTDHHTNHRMGVWSATTGQLLQSPLNERRFAAPVTCADIVRLRDGPKSTLLASNGGIEEWCVQGRGIEAEQE